MPEISFDLPSGISKDVLETDLAHYFGRDAEIVKRKVAAPHYLTESTRNLMSSG
jgi:hypothetical protein